jgi:hypothetical protein
MTHPFALSGRNEFSASKSTRILLYLLGISFLFLRKSRLSKETAKEAFD